MVKETGLSHTEQLSPRTAYFLDIVASNPDMRLDVDDKRVGLTWEGKLDYTSRLRKAMHDILAAVSNDPTIKQSAQKYEQEIHEELQGGTCCVSLSEQERMEFLDFLTRNNCILALYLQEAIYTSVIV